MKRTQLGQAMLVGLTLLGVYGCGASDEDDAKQSLQLWQQKGPASYVYIRRRSCFCTDTEPTRIVVEDGVVKSAIEIESGMAVSGETMTSLLEEVVRTAGRDNSKYTARFNPDLGYLEHESVDHSSRTDDDELTMDITCFGAGSGDDVCPAS